MYESEHPSIAATCHRMSRAIADILARKGVDTATAIILSPVGGTSRETPAIVLSRADDIDLVIPMIQQAVARDRAEAERALAAEKRTRKIYLSSRGWGDYSPVVWRGDITRPAADIAAECRQLLAGSTDVDEIVDDTALAIKIADAKSDYNRRTAAEAAEKKREADCLGKARATGAKVEIRHYTTDYCTEHLDECSFDAEFNDYNNWRVCKVGKIEVMIDMDGRIDHIRLPRQKTLTGSACEKWLETHPDVSETVHAWTARRKHAVETWKNETDHVQYECDRGALALKLNGAAKVLVGNGYGDGSFRAYLLTSSDELPPIFENADVSVDDCTIEVLGYDCGDAEAVAELEVRYATVYRAHGDMAIVYTAAGDSEAR